MGLVSSIPLEIRNGAAERQGRGQGVVLSMSEETTMMTYAVVPE